MSEKSAPTIQRPKTDDRPMWDILSGIFGYPAVLVSHDLKLFALLAERPRTLPEVCQALGIAARPAAMLLSVNAAFGLVSLEDGRYALTPFAEDYLLESSPTSFSAYLASLHKRRSLQTSQVSPWIKTILAQRRGGAEKNGEKSLRLRASAGKNRNSW